MGNGPAASQLDRCSGARGLAWNPVQLASQHATNSTIHKHHTCIYAAFTGKSAPGSLETRSLVRGVAVAPKSGACQDR